MPHRPIDTVENPLTRTNDDNSSEPHLHLSAILSSPTDPTAHISCIEFLHHSHFTPYPTVGRFLPGIADVSNVTYVVLPPRSREGLHKPPHPMFFILLSGVARVTVPPFLHQGSMPSALLSDQTINANNNELWIRPDATGLIVAADTFGVGHHTEYPSDGESVALQIPFADGKVPEYRVVHQGPCKKG